jgi:hypothetical protein
MKSMEQAINTATVMLSACPAQPGKGEVEEGDRTLKYFETKSSPSALT